MYVTHTCTHGIPVQITEKGLFRLATKKGVVRPCYCASSLQLVDSSVITLASMGLDGLLDNDMAALKDESGNWKEIHPLRTHARSVSMTGGQGMTRCSCTGKCDTRSCSCKKAGRECNSRCHRNNTKCLNIQCAE